LSSCKFPRYLAVFHVFNQDLDKAQEDQEDDTREKIEYGSKNEMPSITPAAKQSMLHMYVKDGRFSTPIKDPMIGPSTEMMTIRNMGSIALFNPPF
jgi:hypothetical protein